MQGTSRNSCISTPQNDVPATLGTFNRLATRWCPSSLAKLVNITPITWGYGRYIYT